MTFWKGLVVVVALLVAGSRARAGDVDILDWNLSTSINDDVPPIPLIVTERNQTVRNPFVETQLVSPVANLTAHADYDASWQNDRGSFHVTIGQEIHGRDRSGSTSGTIDFTTAIDVVFNISGFMNFTSSAGDEADFSYGVSLQRGQEPLHLYFANGKGGDFYFEVPPSGSLGFESDDILLFAGTTYRIRYSMGSRTSSFDEQDPIYADSAFDFSWRPVPEPSAAMLLTPTGLIVVARRRRRRASIYDSRTHKSSASETIPPVSCAE